jgi:hypothetical protein
MQGGYREHAPGKKMLPRHFKRRYLLFLMLLLQQGILLRRTAD